MFGLRKCMSRGAVRLFGRRSTVTRKKDIPRRKLNVSEWIRERLRSKSEEDANALSKTGLPQWRSLTSDKTRAKVICKTIRARYSSGMNETHRARRLIRDSPSV
ncbi:hypothetical protein CEXT_392371 [Caerostris extrusa]|uniref:Uncharacterized protein n=1 Tax=Caerostris extrusa TaxID=172846 RepID=A0AAV4Y627_CAEEX|nr:hypothetical protein CEXT_392371 [Caerostris extrusa]